MKLTKVDKKRIAVGKTDAENGRCILYRVPKDEQAVEGNNWEAAVSERVNDANRLYNAFFKADSPRDLESHFRAIVWQVATAKTTAEAQGKLTAYTSFTDRKTNKEKKIAWFSYTGGGKRMENVLVLHVRERLNPIWAENPWYERAAVAVLSCVCDGERYRELVEQLPPDVIAAFWEACRESSRSLYVDSTGELERYFTEILKGLFRDRRRNEEIRKAYIGQDEAAIDRILEKQIAQLRQLSFISVFEKNRQTGRREEKKLSLDAFRYPYATDIRMDAVLVRMRKTLKRDMNSKVAKKLLQGLAGMDGSSFTAVIEEMMRDESRKAELKRFIHAVNKDYFKINVYVSVKNINVKVQPQEEKTNVLAISGVDSAKREGLQDTLVRYAASAESGQAVLREIKGILCDYFLPGDEDAKAEYASAEKLWSVPKRTDYFDYADEVGAELEKEGNLAGLEWLWERGQSERKIKARIKYVNYGRYLKLREKATSDFYTYWIGYIKEFVENTYTEVEQRGNTSGKLKREMCFATAMMCDCWKQIIRYICGKYIDIGKAVYHFAMPEDNAPKNGAEYGVLQAKYEGGLSSFDYEAIKAEETLKRDIAVASVAAISNFTRAVIDQDKHRRLIEEAKKDNRRENKEDILFLGADEVKVLRKADAKTQLLRFYGGASGVQGIAALNEEQLIADTLTQLKAIRNQNFHYADGKKTERSYTTSRLLWQNDSRAYREGVLKKYYSNNTTLFYGEKDLSALVEILYGQNRSAEAQIPAFNNVWKKKDVPADLRAMDQRNRQSGTGADLIAGYSDQIRTIFEGAWYFLLKEIYYRSFIVSDTAAEWFFRAVKENEAAENAAKGPGKGKPDSRQGAAKHFREYVSVLETRYRQKEITFGNICQYIQAEYNQQNANQKDGEIYKHFKMLLPICLKKAFEAYVKEYFGFVFKPQYRDRGETANTCLNGVGITCFADSLVDIGDESVLQDTYAWYSFAHFIHPRQLNLLIGDFKSHIQYREDIWRRKDYAGQFEGEEKAQEQLLLQKDLERTRHIISILEFVREVSGQVSNTFSDYYVDEDAYASYLMQYIDAENCPGKTPFDKLRYFCMNTLPNGQIIDIYADTKNPKVLRNVELARMYAGGDICLKNYGKITGEDMRHYYREQQAVVGILAKQGGESQPDQKIDFKQKKALEQKWKDDRKRVLSQQQRSNRITLNDVTNIHSIINEMLGQLVSLSYLRERDEMYLLMGFYYMALHHSADGWGEKLNEQIDDGTYQVRSGLVLHQIMSIFDFGTDLLVYDEKKGRWTEKGGQLSVKLMSFYRTHRASLTHALKLFNDDKYDSDINELRNYVDHFKFYTDRTKSIVELYNGYYTTLFGYSSKLRKSTLSTFGSILERAFVTPTLRFESRDRIKLEKLESMKFTFKQADKKSMVKLDAKSREFLRALEGNLVSTEA